MLVTVFPLVKTNIETSYELFMKIKKTSDLDTPNKPLIRRKTTSMDRSTTQKLSKKTTGLT